MEPEQKARGRIDALLRAAGWVTQDREAFNRNAALGVAVREFQLPSGPCDYLLFVAGKAAGVIEAKKQGVTLSGVADQSDKYMSKLPSVLAAWRDILVFDYESTGVETFFRDMRDPAPRSRRLFAFHEPETLHAWLTEEKSLRGRLTEMPSLDARGLRDCQVEAIEALEVSLAKDKPRSLIQMATGAGKTFTACSFSYRLLKHADAERILFLVDRRNLGDQTLREFQGYLPPGAANRFADTYITQHLSSNRIEPDAKVVITTIQRVHAMLRGQELDPDEEEASDFETAPDGGPRPVAYNPDIPIEAFDVIIVDECHRSIYGVWRQVLEYFDAHIIGLTATPSKHTLGFFNQNLVSEYTYDRSVADGVNVGFEIFRIRTEVGEGGGTVETGFHVPVRDKRTRAVKYRELEEDLVYSPRELDRSVLVPSQIRTVLQCYRDRLFDTLFEGRTGDWVPKTLIFAKDDNHAEEIVHIARDVFDAGNDFVKKITYRNTGESPKTMIKSFRVDPMPRIAVTVDMIATGTDIKPVEVLIFMRDVKSETYYEQMRGRGVRSIKDANLRQVTPDAQTKTRFVLIDAVGVTEGKKTASQPLERKRTVAFDRLVDDVAMGARDADSLSSLAARLSALEKKVSEDDRQRIADACGETPAGLAKALLRAVDPDVIEARAKAAAGPFVEDHHREAAAQALADEACAPFDDPALRQLLKDVKQRGEIVIDVGTIDTVIHADYDLKLAAERTRSFKTFLAENKDELTALQILYDRPRGQQRLSYAAIKDLRDKLAAAPRHLTTADVWQAYRRLDEAKVKGAPSDKMLTELVALVRFAIGRDGILEPFGQKVEQRFNLWIGRQKKAGKSFSEEQMAWLALIKDHLAANAEIVPADLQEIPAFSDRGGAIHARQLFGPDLPKLLDELSEALVA